MSTKALKTELIAAIAMVLVAVLALSGSTYAWFASNNKVTAGSMKVKATAEGGILIGYAGVDGSTDIADSGWSSAATAAESGFTALYPASTFPESDGSSLKNSWFHASSSTVSSAAAKAGSYTTLTLNNGLNSVDNRNYYLVETFKIKTISDTSTADDLIVSDVGVSGAGSQELNRSLRVAIACGSNVAVYAPVYEGTTSRTDTVVTAINTSGEAVSTDTVTSLMKTTSSTAIAATVTSSPTTVRVYIWFEGEDPNSTSYNANKESVLNDLMITVTFKATLND